MYIYINFMKSYKHVSLSIYTPNMNCVLLGACIPSYINELIKTAYLVQFPAIKNNLFIYNINICTIAHASRTVCVCV